MWYVVAWILLFFVGYDDVVVKGIAGCSRSWLM